MQALPRLYRWTRAEYDHLAAIGAFEGKRVELVGGQIITMSPKTPRHVRLTRSARRALEGAFPAARYTVRSQDPLALGEWDEPEPDVAVVAISVDDYDSAHPTADQTALVVEIAESSAKYDLGVKADLYAAAGIADYWVVNGRAGVVIVLREPRLTTASRTKLRYADRREYRPGDQITPLAAGAAPVAVADLLP